MRQLRKLLRIPQKPRVLLKIIVFVVCSTVYFVLYTHYAINRQSVTSQRRKSSVANGVEVHSVGNLAERLTVFNVFLSSLRVEILQMLGTSDWKQPASGRLNVINGSRDDYLQLLSNYSNVKPVFVPWLHNVTSLSSWSSLRDTSNLVIQTYYDWTANDNLCSHIERNGHQYPGHEHYTNTCNRTINRKLLVPTILQPSFIYGKQITSTSYRLSDGNSYTTHVYTYLYIHIIEDAVVTGKGDVISDNFKLVLHTCRRDFTPRVSSRAATTPLHSEIFVITQFWGYGYFHYMVEVLPRIALFVDFLKFNQQIRILSPLLRGRFVQLLGIIGIDSSRLVAGLNRAKVVYLPRSTRCGNPNVPEIQMLSQLYRNYITRTFPHQPRNKIVLIRRSRKRIFSNQIEIEKVLQRAAADYNLTYTMFKDNPVPSLNDSMMMFHSAVIIVGPHGAGLSNMLFSQPGTYVVEGVCQPPKVNMCYRVLTQLLGHHWHGILEDSQCGRTIGATAASVDAAVRSYLRLYEMERR